MPLNKRLSKEKTYSDHHKYRDNPCYPPNQYAALYKISDQNEGLSAVQPAVNQFYVMPSNRYALLTWKINPDFHAQYVEVWRATESKDNFDEKVNTITVQQSLNDYYQEYDQDSHLFLYEKCYYRLKVINDKEEVQWSDIVEYDANVTHTPIQLNIYTDRTDEDMFINYQLDSDYKQAYLLISDAKGQKLYQSELAKNTISGQVNINISEWEQGTYQVKIMADGTAIQKSCFIP